MVMTAVSFHELQKLITNLSKSLNGRSIQPVLEGDPNGDSVLIRQQFFTGYIFAFNVVLHAQPVRSVILPIVDDKNYGHPFLLPGFQVCDLNPASEIRSFFVNLQRIRCLDLEENMTIFNFAVIAVGKHQHVNPVVRIHTIHREPAQENLPLNMIDT
jgi:hypothetical protein